MAFNLTNAVGTGTDAELLELTRAAIARITVMGERRMLHGRDVTEATLKELRETVEWLEGRVNAADGPAVNYMRRQRAE